MTLRASAIAAAAVAALLAVPAVAYAQDDLAPRAQVCAADTTFAVNDLLSALGDNGLPADLTPIVELTTLTDAGIALDPTVSLAQVQTALLCDEVVAPVDPTEPTTTPEPTPTETPAPTTTTATPAAVTVDGVLARIAALRCDGTFAADLGRVQDDTFALIGSTTSEDLGRISDALNGRLAALGFCVGTPGADTAVDEVTPIVPNSGDSSGGVTQVEVLPSLPAQTGGGPA